MPTIHPCLPVPKSRAEVTRWREGSDLLGTDSALGRLAGITRATRGQAQELCGSWAPPFPRVEQTQEFVAHLLSAPGAGPPPRS